MFGLRVGNGQAKSILEEVSEGGFCWFGGLLARFEITVPGSGLVHGEFWKMQVRGVLVGLLLLFHDSK